MTIQMTVSDWMPPSEQPIKMAGHSYGVTTRNGFFHWLSHQWLSHIRLSRLIGAFLVIFLFVLVIMQINIASISDDNDQLDSPGRRLKELGDLNDIKASDLKFRINELKSIKASVNNELRELEAKRQKLHAEIAGYNTHIDQLKSTYERTHVEFDQLKLTIENTRLEQEELIKRNLPEVAAPHRILPSVNEVAYIAPPSSHLRCRMHNCFDYSRCSLTSQFPVYLYTPDDHVFADQPVEAFVKLSVTHAFDASVHMTYDPNIACLYVVLIGDTEAGLRNVTSAATLERKLKGLPYWRGDGRNHVLLNIARYYGNRDVFEGVNTGRAMVVQSAFSDLLYRPYFDVIIPPSLGISYGDVWDQLPPIVPARKKYLMTYQGELVVPRVKSTVEKTIEKQYTKSPPKSGQEEKNGRNVEYSEMEQLISLDHAIVATLKPVESQYPSDNFRFEFSCESERIMGYNGEWALCGPDSSRQDLLKLSTFALIIAPTNSSIVSTTLMQVRVYEALKYGAIPVILGEYVKLPFEEMLHWQKSSIVLPKARVTELHFYIRSLGDGDLLEMRRHGRLFWEKYFGTTQTIVDTMLATIRTRLGIPPFPIAEEPSPSVFNASFTPLKEQVIEGANTEIDDILGPIETPLPSLRYRRNFTITKEMFNLPGDPFHLYPYTPFEVPLPAEAKFMGSELGFRPIGKGAGGAGKEFNEALGGNVPREQFTVVMLTYEREAVLINAISRLKSLPHLNKVVVVWNNPRPPAEDLRWPDIGVEIHVIRTSKNSLNNRFLPYDAIETEAILSIDDDAHLRHDEIMFGFRVWREARERIVGFPGRFHSWDLKHNSWLYNSNYSCELSMVLTGAAFFHKYYSYLYSYVMPQAIRDKVDEYLNCEDLAMNFLVSHITRQPPIKVTSRWTFRCPGCPKALSVEDSHFHERHKCINYFVQVYGYMPLLYTQFRVDSVLFKTRIPHDKQKCFKFI